jgi:hypothetical protein
MILQGTETLPPLQSEPSKTPSQRNKPNKKTADRFGVLNAFVDCSLSGLSRAELATWLILYRDTRNGTASTGQTDIARRAGVTVRGIQKATAKLIDRGLLVQVFQGGLNRGPSRYRVAPLTNPGS